MIRAEIVLPRLPPKLTSDTGGSVGSIAFAARCLTIVTRLALIQCFTYTDIFLRSRPRRWWVAAAARPRTQRSLSSHKGRGLDVLLHVDLFTRRGYLMARCHSLSLASAPLPRYWCCDCSVSFFLYPLHWHEWCPPSCSCTSSILLSDHSVGLIIYFLITPQPSTTENNE